MLVFHYEHYFDDQLVPFRMHCTKKRFVKLYYANIVDIHYNVKVDNTPHHWVTLFCFSRKYFEVDALRNANTFMETKNGNAKI